MKSTEEFMKLRKMALENKKLELETRLLKEELKRSQFKTKLLMVTIVTPVVNVVIGVFKGR